jgi:hypothetical protein
LADCALNDFNSTFGPYTGGSFLYTYQWCYAPTESNGQGSEQYVCLEASFNRQGGLFSGMFIRTGGVALIPDDKPQNVVSDRV